MPSETFFRLPESKQQRILDAIKDEVARVPYENFSIGNVIRQCGISRGSFYQYFHNKEEIYVYLISGYHQSILNFAKENLLQNGGDFFDMIEKTFRFSVRMMCYKGSKAYRHNLFCNTHLYEKVWQPGDAASSGIADIRNVIDDIDMSRLNVRTEEELLTLFDICLITAMKDLAGILISDDNGHYVLEKYMSKLELLRRAYQKPADA